MDVVTVLWLGVFLFVFLHSDVPVLEVASLPAVQGLEEVLFASTLVFALDLVFLYQWSDQAPGAFVRRQWLSILMVVPFLRFLGMLRVLRAGRLARGFRIVVRARKAMGVHRKGRRTARNAAAALRARNRSPPDSP